MLCKNNYLMKVSFLKHLQFNKAGSLQNLWFAYLQFCIRYTDFFSEELHPTAVNTFFESIFSDEKYYTVFCKCISREKSKFILLEGPIDSYNILILLGLSLVWPMLGLLCPPCSAALRQATATLNKPFFPEVEYNVIGKNYTGTGVPSDALF